MSKVIILDSSPVGLLTQRAGIELSDRCRSWIRRHVATGNRILIPEIIDYEIRRELLRLRKAHAIARLDRLIETYEFISLNTPTLRSAAQLWAVARQTGAPTAAPEALDVDMILAAQVLSLTEPEAIIATSNVAHLSPYTPAADWQTIQP